MVKNVLLTANDKIGDQIYHLLQKDDVSGLEKLLQDDKKLVDFHLDGFSLLYTAYLFDSPKMVEMLLKHGANPLKKDSEGKSLINYVMNTHNDKKNLFKPVLEKQGWKFPKEEFTGEDIREEFEYSGFHITNAGLSEERMHIILSACNTLFAKMKKNSFGKLLYGPLIITSKELDGKVFNEKAMAYKDIKAAALYYSGKDLVLINSDSFLSNVGHNLQLLAHELGHRHWYHFLDASQRQLWSGKFEERALKVTSSHCSYFSHLLRENTPKEKDVLGFEFYDWNKFNYDGFIKGVRAKQKSNRLLELFDGIICHWRHQEYKELGTKERRDFIVGDILQGNQGMGGEMWCAANIKTAADFLKGNLKVEDIKPYNLQRMMSSEKDGKEFYESMKEYLSENSRNTFGIFNGYTIEEPTSTTEYGRNNSAEDYAEAFGNFLANKEMPREIYGLFTRVNNLRTAKKCLAQKQLQNVL